MDRRRRAPAAGSDPGSPGVLSVLGASTPSYAEKGVALRRHRIALPSGVRSGDVTAHEAVLWARGDAEGRLVARLSSGAHVGRVLHGPHVDHTSDCTGRLDLTGLHPGREYDAAVWFEGMDGTRGEVGHVHFRTAATSRRPTSFVWAGGAGGDGFGINPDLGGMAGYAALHRCDPDFLVHAGVVHPDQVIPAEVPERGGTTWRNLVVPEVERVAESVDDFRARHRYHLLDHHVQALVADVPTIAQWDPHETRRGWLPGQVLDDERYEERRVDVLAARARRAWQEYHPVASQAVHMRGSDGFASARIYRRIERGPLLDVFCLDLRTDPRSVAGADPVSGGEPDVVPVLGHEQAEWLLRETAASRAVWTVVVADLPVALAAAHDPTDDLGRVLRGFHDRGVRNVVWLTSGVRWAAAHRYDPARAACGGFDPFWEFAAGPLHAGGEPVGDLGDRFGAEVVWSRGADHSGESPRAGHQFFGHVAVGTDASMSVTVRDGRGGVLRRQELEPVETGPWRG